MLSIAKELFIQGNYHCQKKSMADSVLAILNYDFAAETILKAVIIDRGGSLSDAQGYFKNFDVLLKEFRNNFKNISTQEVENLHRLRNTVQHNSSIPSQQEVIRHKETIEIFFDDVCCKVYSNLTYASISLALFVNSQNEKRILELMEESYAKRHYVDAVYYGKRAVEYHLLLLRLNLKIPRIRYSNPYDDIKDGKLGELGDGIVEVIDVLKKVSDKLHIGVQYNNLEKLFNGRIPSNEQYFNYGSEIKRESKSSQSDAEFCRNITYEFITSTQNLLDIIDLTSPYIFDFNVKPDGCNAEVRIGVICTSAIKDVSVEEGSFFGEETIINLHNSINHYWTGKVNIQRGKQYRFKGRATNQEQSDIISYNYTS